MEHYCYIPREQLMAEHNGFRKLEYVAPTIEAMSQQSASFLSLMKQRRTVRDFSSKEVPASVIENAIATAGTAPSGANMQPWHFVAVNSTDTKRKIRIAAEEEERALYEHRASKEWLDALAPLGTDANKPFLETAPWLIAIFAQKFTIDDNGQKLKNYYTPESVGIATGFLIAALHNAGLATLTHTPSPMTFLRSTLGRPDHEKPFLLLVTGYPTEDAMVPDISRKPLDNILSIV